MFFIIVMSTDIGNSATTHLYHLTNSEMIENPTPVESNTSNNMVSKMIAVSKAAPDPVSSFDFLIIVLIGVVVSGIMMRIR